MQATAMVVLDFSGTLSLQAALFGRPENLIRELQVSGLWRIGVTSAQMFWDEIVNPTWEEGSTTTKGYQRLLCKRVQQVLLRRGDGPSAQEILAAVSGFVDRYFQHSVIDLAWKELIDHSVARPGTWVVVATDHYAEATACILGQLELLGIACVPALGRAERGQVIVANSADLGHRKMSRGFWEGLRRAQEMETLSVLVVVDDFGFNEQPLDAYADPGKTAERLKTTVGLLSAVFGARVAAFPFFLRRRGEGTGARNAEEPEREYRELIKEAESLVASQLSIPA